MANKLICNSFYPSSRTDMPIPREDEYTKQRREKYEREDATRRLFNRVLFVLLLGLISFLIYLTTS